MGRINYEHWKKVPVRAWPWRYFQPREVACRGTGKLEIESRMLDCLDGLRRVLAHPITVLSCYRSPYHNARVGGAPLSLHLKGKACDLSIVGQDRKLIERLAQESGFTGFGYYRTFLHVDLGRPRWWASKGVGKSWEKMNP